jgi:hypothetical protein
LEVPDSGAAMRPEETVMAVRTRQVPRPHAPKRSTGSSRWLALAVLCVSILVVNLDNTVLNVALPTLVRDLHATSSQLQWIVDAYALVFGGLLLAHFWWGRCS